MEVASPPKRMTRARAAAKDAAKANTSAGKDTAAATSTKSAKATSTTTTRPTTTTRTATKRKTRADDSEDEDNQQTDAEQQNTMNKPARTRGRPKKMVESQSEPESAPQPEASIENTSTASTKASRSRAKRAATATTTNASKPEPAKTRASSRVRKATTATTEDESDEEPVAKSSPTKSTKPARKTTRTRATSSTKSSTAKSTAGTITNTVSTEPTPGLKSAVSRPASRTGGATKKTVTFQEPEKENMVPPAAPKTRSKATEPATGMRAKPVRKPAASTRATRASARTATNSEKRDKSPLSPKKDAENLSLSRDADSDDELATLEKTPLKPMMKSPVKPPSMAKKPDLQPPTKDGEDDAKEASEPTTSSAFGSPARRPPSSPFKDTMKSPARKVEAIPSLLFSANTEQQDAQAPSKPSILQSPAKRPQLPIKSLQPPSQESGNINHSPIKMSLLQSPAKRPMSPFKLQGHPAPMFDNSPDKLFAPTMSPVQESPVQDKVPTEEVQQPAEQPEAMDIEDEFAVNEENEESEEEQIQPESPSMLAFPGRLSAVLPRHADPALKKNPLPAKEVVMTQSEPAPIKPVETQEEPAVEATVKESEDDPMEIDEVEAKQEEASAQAPTTPPLPSKQAANLATKSGPNSAFGLRAKDLVDHDVSDSEDELAPSEKAITKFQDDTTSTLSAVPATPTPSTFKANRIGMPSSAIKAASRAIRSVSKGSKFGYPLSSPSKQAGSQLTAPPEAKEDGYSLIKDSDTETTRSTPSKGFFDEEMRIRAEMEDQAAIEAALEAEIEAMYGDTEPEFDDIPITEEDVQLANEANEMSLIEEDAVSEASQEYGDENAVPIDPALLGSNGRRLDPVTPSRPSAPKPFNTTTKVPLKPADDSTPRIVKKRSASVSKLPPTDRPGGHFRSATVISYSPTKDSHKMEIDGEDDTIQYPPVTPTKSDIWSSMGTPGRIYRRDLNMTLLRGAVVFVDVHTSDGADASTVFVELLQQMGARCVKSWPWNPTSPTGAEGSQSKVGITHVVYKDGGKRTLEKVRETGGLVQCVGVGWVLDCERENQWLDESPYYVDTSLVPRGGHNRRKSMEPKALANFNGTLVTPMKQTGGSARECQTVPNNHISRRDSTAWMRTPSDHDEDEDAPCEHDWDKEISMLTPVPKTPAPEAVRQFAMDVTPDSSYVESSCGDFSPEKELLMRTCPPKSYADLGEGVLKREKDQGILMRLMAARRKSLQFAPKVASPLSKAWN
ncbi:uncharacterized protein F4807DRAFT_85862 [Annulohypoxylon truncatum]|uniref:uncharacterized protein n=1 Tax=Annulohypoxylon truncatum TaxID=327061 RepID=UPI002007965A|nr:uncharacterized protein F4807DRAFT_85862 [Annulohypoxylon truncatum]KAI1209675.1 hypothetical protein F4807DRAFT_85862 [Annulohypoxylon truncatum]